MSTRKILLASVLTLSCWFLADTINVYVSHALLPMLPVQAPAGEPLLPSIAATPSDPKEMTKAILSSGLFVVPAKVSALDPEAAEAAPPPPPPIELEGKLKLLGTVIGERGHSSAAIESVSDHKQRLYFLQDTIDGFGQLSVIAREGVTIRQGNRQGYLPLVDGNARPFPIAIAPPASAKPAAPRMVDRRALKESLTDVSTLLTEARAMPYYNLRENGKLEGWQLIEIKPKSVLDHLGLVHQDVLLRINGTPVLDPATLLRLLQEVQHEKIVKLDLLRHTDPLTLTYEIR